MEHGFYLLVSCNSQIYLVRVLLVENCANEWATPSDNNASASANANAMSIIATTVIGVM